MRWRNLRFELVKGNGGGVNLVRANHESTPLPRYKITLAYQQTVSALDSVHADVKVFRQRALRGQLGSGCKVSARYLLTNPVMYESIFRCPVSAIDIETCHTPSLFTKGNPMVSRQLLTIYFKSV